jgi:hypothetical protein
MRDEMNLSLTLSLSRRGKEISRDDKRKPLCSMNRATTIISCSCPIYWAGFSNVTYIIMSKKE